MTVTRPPQYDRANVTMSYREAADLLHGTLSDEDAIRLAKRLDKARNDYVESTLGVRNGKRAWVYLRDGREFDGVLRRVFGTYRWSIVERDDTCDACGRGEATVVEFTADDVAEVCNAVTCRPVLCVGARVRRTVDGLLGDGQPSIGWRLGATGTVVHVGPTYVDVVVDGAGDRTPFGWDGGNFEVIA